MTTIYDVAKKAGVSPATVSRVLNKRDNVTDATKKRVKDACEELNYVPNTNASSLRKKNTDTLAIIIPDIQNPFFTSILKGFEDKTSLKGYNTIVCATDENSAREKDYLRMIMAKRIDGLAISTVSKTSGHLQEVINRDIPFVLMDRKIQGLDVDVVCGDSYQGAVKLVNHLIELGHNKIAIISGPLHLSTSRERLQGYKAALDENEIKVNSHFIRIDKQSEGYSAERAYELTKELIKSEKKPTAIFAGNNFMALGVYKRLREEGLEVPDDMAVVCFDGLNLIYEINPFFTAMKQPAYTMGKMAAEILVNKIEGNYEVNKQKVVLQPELVVRKSCGAMNKD